MKDKYVLYFGQKDRTYSLKANKILNRLVWVKIGSYYSEEQALKMLNRHEEKYTNKLKLVKETIIYCG